MRLTLRAHVIALTATSVAFGATSAGGHWRWGSVLALMLLMQLGALISRLYPKHPPMHVRCRCFGSMSTPNSTRCSIHRKAL